MDKARIETDKRLKQMERHIRQVYKQAQGEMTEKWNAYMNRGKERLNNLYADYMSAPIDQKAEALKRYQDALQSYTLRNKWYKDMVAQTTYRIANVNKIAISYINGQIPGIYALNFNDIDPALTDIGINWTLRDEYMIRNLMWDSLPQKELDYDRDMAWNQRQINSSVLQGVIQGESIPKIAARLLPVVGNNEKSAIRTARTMVTGAENKGRLDRYQDYEDNGVLVEKIWLATPDGRTRDWHIAIDGQEVPIDEPFVDGHGNELDYPGDEMAEPETVYNCFTGDTLVTANADILRTYKHDYKGNLITIKTAGGVQFTCTPNHPILTLRGWVAAYTLNEGDDILVTFACDRRIFRFNPDIDHIFTSFNTLHELGDKSVREWATNLNVNFHGDIPTSDVEIVAQKRLLGDNRNAGTRKSLDKFMLEPSNMPFTGKRTFVEHFRRVWLSSFGRIGSRYKAFTFFRRSLAHAKKHGIRPVAWGNSGTFKPINNYASGNIEVLGKCLDGFSGIVCADKIVNVDVEFSHCDVFNLQSENGYYFVNSNIAQNSIKDNGIVAISHNCRCSMRSHIIGIRNSDGSVNKIKNYGMEKSHTSAIKEEKRRREEEEE